jgi:hypothetical protein
MRAEIDGGGGIMALITLIEHTGSRVGPANAALKKHGQAFGRLLKGYTRVQGAPVPPVRALFSPQYPPDGPRSLLSQSSVGWPV